MTLGFTTAANPEGTRPDDLIQELQDILAAFCSSSQQQFCLDHGVFGPEELQAWKMTMEEIHVVLPTLRLDRLDPRDKQHPSLRLYQSLLWTLCDIVQGFDEACQQRHMSSLDEIKTNQWIDDWHRLKRQWDAKAKENTVLENLLEDISLLATAWLPSALPIPARSFSKRLASAKIKWPGAQNNISLPRSTTHPPRQHFLNEVNTIGRSATAIRRSSHPASSATFQPSLHFHDNPSSASLVSPPFSSFTPADGILTSILTTFDYPNGVYMVTIDQVNCSQLGMEHCRIGSRQLIFDARLVSPSETIATVARICEHFAALFSTTAQQHIGQVDSQVRKAQPFYTASQLKRLSSCLFDSPSPSLLTDADDDDHPPQQQAESARTHRRSVPLASPSRSAANHSTKVPWTPFRLSLTTPHMLWHHPIPIPCFTLAPWQLPSLLKPRHPYDACFFGLIRRRPHRTAFLHIDGHAIMEDEALHQDDLPTLSLQDNPPPPPQRKKKPAVSLLWSNPQQPPPPFISVSVAKLAMHLGKIAGQFYQDVAAHTRLRHHETAQTLEALDWEMTEVYRHLQLASACAVMHRALAITQYLHPPSLSATGSSIPMPTFPPPPSSLPHSAPSLHLHQPQPPPQPQSPPTGFDSTAQLPPAPGPQDNTNYSACTIPSNDLHLDCCKPTIKHYTSFDLPIHDDVRMSLFS
ncbi:hypothetical protein DM01DRAFT_1347534 [Hesseltinella vesiculosa]|uniref:Uncharacterized protein n=1 Tax=Hesseltinella vesiculosa TaxID=101127 RepID=A0A1X2GBV5_9FUNG|nr:hypothetical protein DM01DRAFT_1347534 [Hesseltinella vesiculosa]